MTDSASIFAEELQKDARAYARARSRRISAITANPERYHPDVVHCTTTLYVMKSQLAPLVFTNLVQTLELVTRDGYAEAQLVLPKADGVQAVSRTPHLRFLPRSVC